MILLERDEAGELHTVEVQADIALARCPCCGTRPRVLPYDVLPYERYTLAVIAEQVATDAKARVAQVGAVREAEFRVDERRYRSEARHERLAGMAKVIAVAKIVTGLSAADALAQCRRLILAWSGSCSGLLRRAALVAGWCSASWRL